MVYPINYVGTTHRWYAESMDGVTIVVGDIAPGPGASDLALNLAMGLLGRDNVSRIMPEWEYEPVAA